MQQGPRIQGILPCIQLIATKYTPKDRRHRPIMYEDLIRRGCCTPCMFKTLGSFTGHVSVPCVCCSVLLVYCHRRSRWGPVNSKHDPLYFVRASQRAAAPSSVTSPCPVTHSESGELCLLLAGAHSPRGHDCSLSGFNSYICPLYICVL